jgi:hypothetical protein
VVLRDFARSAALREHAGPTAPRPHASRKIFTISLPTVCWTSIGSDAQVGRWLAG